MTTRFSRLFLAGGQNTVPISGWFLGGWTPGTTLVLFWFENLVLSLFIAARIAAHWQATRTRGHANGFLRTFLLTSTVFTLGHGVFLFFVLGQMLPDTVNRDDVWAGLQWILGVQVASLVIDSWSLARWPFAEIRGRVDWILGRVVAVHLSILGGMFLFMAMGQPWWFFSTFVVLKAMMDIGTIVPQWKPKEPPRWLSRAMNRVGRAPGARGVKEETFEEHWARTNREEAARHARDEEVVNA